MLKVGEFTLVDVMSPNFDKEYNKVIISKENSMDEYFLKNDRVLRYIGINSTVDVCYVQNLIESAKEIEIDELYKAAKTEGRGKLVCSCTGTYYNDLVDIVTQNAVNSFADLKEFSEAGRVCGRCRGEVVKIIEKSQCLIDPNLVKKRPEEKELEKKLKVAKKRVEKFNKEHPRNALDEENLEAAMQSMDIQLHLFTYSYGQLTHPFLMTSGVGISHSRNGDDDRNHIIQRIFLHHNSLMQFFFGKGLVRYI